MIAIRQQPAPISSANTSSTSGNVVAKASSVKPTAWQAAPTIISVRSLNRPARLPTNGAMSPIDSSRIPNGSDAAARDRPSSRCNAGSAGPNALMTVVRPRL